MKSFTQYILSKIEILGSEPFSIVLFCKHFSLQGKYHLDKFINLTSKYKILRTKNIASVIIANQNDGNYHKYFIKVYYRGCD